VHEEQIKNVIVCDNFELANQIAKVQYGDTAIAVDTTLYPVTIGDSYIDGFFYNQAGTVIERNLSDAEQITALKQELNRTLLEKAESELDIDERLSKLELGLYRKEVAYGYI
jgi:hypothetical protein